MTGLALEEFQMAFAVPGDSVIKDCAIKGADGIYRSWVYQRTLEEMREEYPGVELVNLEEFVEKAEQAAITDPVEITKEQFDYALEVLPPYGWECGETESFYMSEFVTGNITTHYVRLYKRFFSFNDRPINHAARIKKVKDWLIKVGSE